jgi:hypothetical protein
MDATMEPIVGMKLRMKASTPHVTAKSTCRYSRDIQTISPVTALMSAKALR